MPVELDLDAIIREAGRRIGTSAEPPSHVVAGLRLLLAEVEHRCLLTREGRRLLQHEALRVIMQRAAIERAIEAAEDRFLGEALIITGLPRTSSTLLHNLLADLGSFDWLPMWKALEPSSNAPQSQQGALERGIRQVEFMRALSPDLLHIHPMRIDRPEECISLLQLTGASDRFSISLTAPDYLEWTVDPGVIDSTYRDYARILNVIFDGSRPVLLKAPSHALRIGGLLDHMPRAQILWLERDIEQVEASFARLVEASRRVFQSNVNPDDWKGRWRDIEPPEGAHVLRFDGVQEFARLSAARYGVPEPSATRHADWLQPTRRESCS